jgi:hypothetical protein
MMKNCQKSFGRNGSIHLLEDGDGAVGAVDVPDDGGLPRKHLIAARNQSNNARLKDLLLLLLLRLLLRLLRLDNLGPMF